MNICSGINSDVLRGDVRFSPALIAPLTEAWVAFERSVLTSMAASVENVEAGL